MALPEDMWCMVPHIGTLFIGRKHRWKTKVKRDPASYLQALLKHTEMMRCLWKVNME